MPRARIDWYAVQRLIAVRFATVGGVTLRYPGEKEPSEPSALWARLIGIDRQSTRTRVKGPDAGTDRAAIVVTIEVVAPPAATKASAYALDRALTAIEHAMTPVSIDEVSGTGHMIDLETFDARPDPPDPGAPRERRALVTITGTAVRVAGTSVE